MRRAFATFIALWLLLTLAIFYNGYQSRSAIVDSQRSGCARGKLDRSANALGWRNAERARREAGEHAVADVYSAIAAGLEDRSRINCKTEFPKPPFIDL